VSRRFLQKVSKDFFVAFTVAYPEKPERKEPKERIKRI
jgi:hypothetical protein